VTVAVPLLDPKHDVGVEITDAETQFNAQQVCKPGNPFGQEPLEIALTLIFAH
jgi:hypothetical protein